MEEDGNSLAALHAWLAERVEAFRPSDWHLEPGRDGYGSRLRVDGRLGAAETLPRDRGDWLVQSIISRTGHHGTAPGRPLEGRFTLPMGAGDPLPLRVSIVPGLHGPAVVVRFLYPAQHGLDQLEQLGLRDAEIQWLRGEFAAGEGLWLVAGPTGSGKSTTLHALLHGSVERREKVLAVEDPVERTLAGVQHVSVGHPPGMTFARALRAFLRQAPDCLMVGEIRDPETAGIALQAARAGHRVLSSIHARDTAGVLRRFEDLDQPAHLVNPVCRVLIHQRLIPLLCPACVERAPLPHGFARALAPFDLAAPDSMAVARGCHRCRDGYKGRTAVFSAGTLVGPDTTRDDLLAAAWNRFLSGAVDRHAIQPLAPAGLRDVLRFATPDLCVTTVPS